MGAFFDFSLLDVWNRPEVKILRKGTTMVAKGLASAGEKEKLENSGTQEFAEMVGRARAGNAEAQCDLALYYAENHDFDEATEWLVKSARQGNERARGILEFLQGG